jgi:hypothetical protein
MKILQLKIGEDLAQTYGGVDEIKSLQGVKITQTSSRSLKDWGDLSFLSSLL